MPGLGEPHSNTLANSLLPPVTRPRAMDSRGHATEYSRSSARRRRLTW